jgi:signal transduction histidine kinase
MPRRALVIALIAADAGVVVAGFGAYSAARHGESALGGGGWPALALQVGTVAALAGVGAARVVRRDSRVVGALLLGAALTFALAIAPPQFVGFDLWFSAELATVWTAPLTCVCTALLWPRSPRRTLRLLAGAALVPALLSGLAPELLFEPHAEGCNSCGTNLLAITSAPDTRASLVRVALIAVIVWSVAALAALAARAGWLPRAERTVIGPVLGAGAAVAAMSIASAAHQLTLPTPEVDRTVQVLWNATCAAALMLAVSIAATASAWRRAAQALARDLLLANPSIESLRRSFAELVGDRDLVLVVNPVAATHSAGVSRGATVQVSRGDAVVAEVRVDPRFAASLPRLAEAARAAGLALEYASACAKLADEEAALQESRRRVVHTGDAARYAAERNLHDGAQQRLFAIALSLVALRRQLTATDDIAALDLARAVLAGATEELRLISHGLFPESLRDDGLIAAVREYQMRSPIAILLVPGDLEPPVGADAAMAAYRLVVDACQALADRAGHATVALHSDAARFEITFDSTAAVGVDALQHAIDRFHALDGDITVIAGTHGWRIVGWAPCAS